MIVLNSNFWTFDCVCVDFLRGNFSRKEGRRRRKRERRGRGERREKG